MARQPLLPTSAGPAPQRFVTVAVRRGRPHAEILNPAPMPYLKIQTNLPIGKKSRQTILRNASALVALELEKPEELVMVALQDNTTMLFAGSDDPVAFLELKSVGLPGRKTKRLSQALCSLIEDHLGITKDRVYVKFIDVNRGMWGWKGDTL
jgi:phenylpyruvate tautomerase